MTVDFPCISTNLSHLFISAIRVGFVRTQLLPHVQEGNLLPLSHPARPELLAQDRGHPGHPILPGQLILQHLRPPR